MEKLNFVKDGIVKLPPGFRFQPTDEEIVFQYLTRKIYSFTLPASIVPEVTNIFQYTPWDLPGECEENRYFFNKNGNRSNIRSGGSSYWKASGSDIKITSSRKKHNHDVMGMKKTFVFYNNKATTNWIMQEYRLVQSQNSNSSQSSFLQIGSWVLCHIFLKISGEHTDDADSTSNYQSPYYPTSYCSSSSSSTSAVTDEASSSRYYDDDEETSCYKM